MIRGKYVDKIVGLIELGVPVADTRIELEKILKNYFLEQTHYQEHKAAQDYLDAEDMIAKIEG